jgi:hypothetical protein
MAAHPGFPTPSCLRPLLYWGTDPGERPQDFVDARVPSWAREAIAFVLSNGVDAHPGIQAMGWADCRICGAQLGSMDLTRFGYAWPEKAEHYLVEHNVWTFECDELLRAVLAFAAST